MSGGIDERIEEAWLKREAYHAVTTAPLHGDIAAIARKEFEAGYRAALRSIFPEVDSREMIDGRYYWIGGGIGEMHGFEFVVGSDGVSGEWWPVVDDHLVNPMLFAIRGPIPNGSDLPSPSEIFGEGG